MDCYEGLSQDQIEAITHHGCHARLLSGPGTGKTQVIIKHVNYLISEKGVEPKKFLILTFTRAAVYELKKRISENTQTSKKPIISTLHSFSLQQLIKNSQIVDSLPKPIRIADDWEERKIIYEDLNRKLGKVGIKEVKELFHKLSSDWESLIDEKPWDVDGKFISQWESNRMIYGYTLRAELVYQLKKTIEQREDFNFGSIQYLIVDEYQDLNKCDLAVIKYLTSKGAELFAAGDDDQSIYGFRKAFPQGIRNFFDDYPDGKELSLKVCRRCDGEILKIAEFVAGLDVNRATKEISCEPGKDGGEVAILSFPDQDKEAKGVAELCNYLINHDNYKPGEILILLRADKNGVYSEKFLYELSLLELPVYEKTTKTSIFNEDLGRQFLAILRLLINSEDHLAWRTCLEVRKNNDIGKKRLDLLYDECQSRGIDFFGLLKLIEKGENIPIVKKKVIIEYQKIVSFLDKLKINAPTNNQKNSDNMKSWVKNFVNLLESEENQKEALLKELEKITSKNDAPTLEKLYDAIVIKNEGWDDIATEPELESDKINIITMHQAKGLTKDVVFIVVAEDEHIPGINDEEPDVGDERRLLYVSITRAKHKLFITHCNRRKGKQKNYGRNSKSRNSIRTLTRFLRNSQVKSIPGKEYIEKRINTT
jgi:DNA helicase-2/ATP-dependent DNA helicase PcrA